MPYIIAEIQLHLPACHSLKEKRAILAPVLNRLHKANLSIIESGKLDAWQYAQLSFAMIAANSQVLDQQLEAIRDQLDHDFTQIELVDLRAERYL